MHNEANGIVMIQQKCINGHIKRMVSHLSKEYIVGINIVLDYMGLVLEYGVDSRNTG